MRWPTTWEKAKGFQNLTLVLAAFLALSFILIGLLTVAGDRPMALLALVLGQFMLAALCQGYVVQHAGRRRGTHEVRLLRTGRGPVTFLPRSPAANLVTQAMLVSAAVLFLSAPFLATALAGQSPGGNADRFRMLSMWLPLLVPICLAYVASPLVRKRREMGLGLSSGGVYHWSWFGCCFYPWHKIRAVSALAHRGPVIRLVIAPDEGRRSGRRAAPDGEETRISANARFRNSMRNIPAGMLAVDPAIAYHTLTFYQARVALRNELESEAGVARVQRAGFA